MIKNYEKRYTLIQDQLRKRNKEEICKNEQVEVALGDV